VFIQNEHIIDIETDSKIKLSVLCLHKLHPEIQGNKYYKLLYNLEEAIQKQSSAILTFGGVYSNHIHSASIAGKANRIKTIGIIRGEKRTCTIDEAEKNGMQIHFIDRESYRKLRIQEFEDKAVIQTLRENGISIPENTYILPEGGSNRLAVKGSEKIAALIPESYRYICTPVGTGSTMAGIISGLNGKGHVLGFSSLKGNFSHKDVNALLETAGKAHLTNREMMHDFHFGGFGKWNSELIEFINQFYREHKIPLCPLYTGKMMYGIFQLIKNGYFPEGASILAIHTGGLQGIKGFNEVNGNLIDTEI
jgi:1-aminocyclopropane-1-carboxylate deaminase